MPSFRTLLPLFLLLPQVARAQRDSLPLLALATPNAYGVGWEGPRLFALPSGWLVTRNPDWEDVLHPYLGDSIGLPAIHRWLDSLGYNPGLLGLDSLYEPDSIFSTHPDFRILYLRIGTAEGTVAVRGELPTTDPGPAGLYAFLHGLDTPPIHHRRPYSRFRVEFVIAPSYGPAATSDWPGWLPKPGAKGTGALGGDRFRIILAPSVLRQFKALCDSTPSRPVVMVHHDRLWVFEGVRYLFRGEERWLSAARWAPE